MLSLPQFSPKQSSTDLQAPATIGNTTNSGANPERFPEI